MKPGAFRFVVVALIIAASACQTTPPPSDPSTPTVTPTAPDTKPAATSPVVKTVEPIKPITPEMARNLANNCFTCHGPAGKSPGAIPSLTRFNASDMAVRLKRFKNGEDASTIMGRHTRGYTDTELEAIAIYIAGLKK